MEARGPSTREHCVPLWSSARGRGFDGTSFEAAVAQSLADASIPSCAAAGRSVRESRRVGRDFLYRSPHLATRDEADRVLLEAMVDLGVGWVTRQIIYHGGRIGGGASYHGNTYVAG